MIDDFMDWLEDIFSSIGAALKKALEVLYALLCIILLFPLWILPFLIWFICVREKKAADGSSHTGECEGVQKE